MNPKLIPEELQGIEIDWKGYVPPCGEQFQEHIETRQHDLLEEILNKYSHQYSSFKTAIERVGKIEKELVSVCKTMSLVEGAINHDIQSCFDKQQERIYGPGSSATRLSDKTLAWLREGPEAVREMIEWTKQANSWKEELGIIEGDVTLLKSLQAFFIADRNLDIALWALHACDKRFKMKIFRFAQKSYRQADEARLTVLRSKSALKRVLMDTMGEAFETTSENYDQFKTIFKLMKKGVEANGVAYFDDKKDAPTINRVGQRIIFDRQIENLAKTLGVGAAQERRVA